MTGIITASYAMTNSDWHSRLLGALQFAEECGTRPEVQKKIVELLELLAQRDECQWAITVGVAVPPEFNEAEFNSALQIRLGPTATATITSNEAEMMEVTLIVRGGEIEADEHARRLVERTIEGICRAHSWRKQREKLASDLVEGAGDS